MLLSTKRADLSPTGEPAGGGVLRGPPARLRAGQDAGEDARVTGDAGCGEGDGPHLRPVCGPALRKATGAHRVSVRLSYSQYSSRETDC